MSTISSELDAQYELSNCEMNNSELNHSELNDSAPASFHATGFAEQKRSHHKLSRGQKKTAKASEMNLSLSAIEQRYDVWRGRSITPQSESLSTGHQSIDDSLHIGGWPRAGLLEVLLNHPGNQELSLLMPAIAQHLKSQQRVAFIGLPYLLLPSALKNFGVPPQQVWCVQTPKVDDQLWAMQQLLKSGHCLMVIAWQLNQNIRNDHLRKLQVAAKSGQTCGVIFRHERYQQQASPASMRVQVSAYKSSNSDRLENLSVKVLKQPKSFAGQVLSLEHPLKKHQQLIRKNLPVFCSEEKKSSIVNGLNEIGADQVLSKKTRNHEILESIKDDPDQLKGQPQFSDNKLQ